ncbi:MAG: hypothetical protein WBK91_03605 [Alphaproteobacteria bacterium]
MLTAAHIDLQAPEHHGFSHRKVDLLDARRSFVQNPQDCGVIGFHRARLC